MLPSDTLFATALKRSGVDTPCQKCHGLGRHIYSHGSTWRGGVGTCGGVWDICDACWGSGDATQPFEDRRAIEAEWKEQLAKASLENWLGRGVMAHFYATHEDAQWVAREVIQFLDSLDRRRKNPVPVMAQGLVEVLKESLQRLIGEKSDG